MIKEDISILNKLISMGKKWRNLSKSCIPRRIRQMDLKNLSALRTNNSSINYSVLAMEKKGKNPDCLNVLINTLIPNSSKD